MMEYLRSFHWFFRAILESTRFLAGGRESNGFRALRANNSKEIPIACVLFQFRAAFSGLTRKRRQKRCAQAGLFQHAAHVIPHGFCCSSEPFGIQALVIRSLGDMSKDSALGSLPSRAWSCDTLVNGVEHLCHMSGLTLDADQRQARFAEKETNFFMATSWQDLLGHAPSQAAVEVLRNLQEETTPAVLEATSFYLG